MLKPTVYLIDDDPDIRSYLQKLLESVDVHTKDFGSAQEFLDAGLNDQPACLVVDVRLPRISGLELLKILRSNGHQIPAIVLTGHADVGVAVRAMKLDVVDFLEKPVNEHLFLDAINQALKKAEEIWLNRRRRAEAHDKLASLTDRERDVLNLLVTGKSHKAIAAELGISPKTLSIHRTHIRAKLNTDNLVDMGCLLRHVADEDD